jgi:glycosyltransferase involved in cell wall biosynthesis
VAVSDAVKQRLLDAGTPAERIRVIRAGVDLTRFRVALGRREGAGRILFAGRLDAVKRPLLLVDIAEKLRRLRPEFRFIVAGDGPELSRLRERVKRKQLEMFFEFLGALEDLAPVFESCDIVILPSRSEGVPLVLLEALACARPVVASRVGGIPQLIDAACGILIDQKSGEAAEFGAALDALLRDPARREKMGLAGRKRVEAGYDIRAMQREYSEILVPGQSPAAA